MNGFSLYLVGLFELFIFLRFTYISLRPELDKTQKFFAMLSTWKWKKCLHINMINRLTTFYDRWTQSRSFRMYRGTPTIPTPLQSNTTDLSVWHHRLTRDRCIFNRTRTGIFNRTRARYPYGRRFQTACKAARRNQGRM